MEGQLFAKIWAKVKEGLDVIWLAEGIGLLITIEIGW